MLNWTSMIVNPEYIIRMVLFYKLRFYLSNKSNSFLSSVLSFYEKNGKITDKQFNAVAKSIGWICISK